MALSGLKTNIREYLDKTPPNFYGEKLVQLDEYVEESIRLFSSQTSKIEDVDATKIIGHNQCYSTIPWGRLCSDPERLDLSLSELKAEPEYYLDDDVEKIHWSFINIEDKYFIESGKHRTLIFKCLHYYNPNFFKDGAIIKDVMVTTMCIDSELEKVVHKIAAILATQKYQHLKLRFWKELGSNYQFEIKNKATNRAKVYSQEDIVDFLDILETSNSLKVAQIDKYKFLRKSPTYPW